MKRAAQSSGATLIELMTIVVIVAVLGAIAAPMLGRYIRRAQTAEATEALNRIAYGAKAYYETKHTDAEGRPLARQFPSMGATETNPASRCCVGATSVCTGTVWTAATWEAMRFQVVSPHRYHYQFTSAGTDTAAVYTAFAFGDLDCDDTTASWTVKGSVDANTRLVDSTLPFVAGGPNNELE